MSNDAMLWPVSVPPLDLCEVSNDINDVARRALIERLVCDSSAEFDLDALRDWIVDFVYDNQMSPKMCPKEWALREILNLAAGYDEGGATGPACINGVQLSWETVARMALDLARGGLSNAELTHGFGKPSVETKEGTKL